MQTTTRYPLILKLLLGLGGVWLASLIMLLLAPMINAYGHAFGIPILSYMTGVTVIAAMLVLFLSMPLSWGLACVGLILEWLARHRSEPKSKLKRKPRPEGRCVLSNVAQRVTVQRLAESREIRQESTEVELCQGLEVELEMGIRRGRN